MAPAELTSGLAGDRIVSARLLILQSKRILLSRALSRVRFRGLPEPNARVIQLEGEVRTANDIYRESVLKFAPVDSSQYWLVAYDTLVEEADLLFAAMERAAPNLPQPDRGDMVVDARRLEGLIERWRQLVRATMAQDVA